MTNEAIPDHPTVVAVVVTWNRLKLMTERVTMLGLQTRRPDVVVDNASTDGSVEVARTQFPDVDLVTLTRDTGGRGGFRRGLRDGFRTRPRPTREVLTEAGYVLAPHW